MFTIYDKYVIVPADNAHNNIVTTCAQYSDLLDRAQLLMERLLKQDYAAPMLKSSLQK
jgi:hypothetical protein